MNKKYLLLFIFITTICLAQKRSLGNVTIDELKEKSHPLDSSAAAAILYKKGNVYFKIDTEGYWNVVTEVEVKIKIYKKEAYDLANFEKEYYSGTYGESLFLTDEATYNLVDGKVEKTKLKSNGEFTEQTNKNYKTKKITLPNVKEGSIIEYKYELVSRFYSNFEDFYFQYDIPVNYIEYKVRTPEYFEYKKALNGYLVLDQKDEILKDINGNYDEYRTTYSLSNVRAMKEEEYVNNINNFKSHINYELSSKKGRDGSVEKFAEDWESVTKKIYENDDFGRQLDKNNYYEDDLNVLVQGLTTVDEKINIIFNYVKNRMTWNEYNGYNCDVGVKAAYKNKVGNTAEINLILVSMLRSAQIDASPIILSTRKNGIKIFPSRTAFNYVIAGVELDNKILLLDATSKNTIPNILPRRALNYIGRIIRKNVSSAEIDLTPKMISKENYTIMIDIAADGVATGKVRVQYFDYNAFDFREKYMSVSKESHVERLEKKYAGTTIADLDIQNMTDFTNPVQLGYSFENNKEVEIIGDKMYFSPMLFFALTENPFKQEKREYPIDFVYPFQDKYTMSFKIPEGYVVETIPKVITMEMEDKLGGFKYNISNNGQQIMVSVVVSLNQPAIGPEYYETLKDFFKQMIEKQNEKIVLKKN